MSNPPLLLVVDPNVYVSSAVAPGSVCDPLVDLIDDADVVAASCPVLLAELRRVLVRPKFHKYFSPQDALEYCATLAERTEQFDDPDVRRPYTADPADDYLVALAVETRADAIVSGDSHLLDAEDLPVPVWSPRAALTELSGPSCGGRDPDTRLRPRNRSL